MTSSKIVAIKLSVEAMKEMIENVEHPSLNLTAVHYIRVLLMNTSDHEINYIDIVIDANLVPHLVRFLKDETNSAVQFEACWALCNIAAGNSKQTRVVIDAGAVPCFVTLLRSQNDDVIEQAVWALANVAGDGKESCDIVLEYGVVDELIKLLEDDDLSVKIRRQMTWLMVNLSRETREFHKIEKILPWLVKFLKQDGEDEEVLLNVCWAIAYVSDISEQQIQMIVDLGCSDRLVQLLKCDQIDVFRPALRVIGNIVASNDVQTQAVLEADVLPVIDKLLSNEDADVVKEAVWILSNVAAG